MHDLDQNGRGVIYCYVCSLSVGGKVNINVEFVSQLDVYPYTITGLYVFFASNAFVAADAEERIVWVNSG